MKKLSYCYRQKRTKQGMALSTAMVICIVLALFVALLASMATLNITTTQATVGQRDAYIQAKSAIAFAESYYCNVNNNENKKIPGVDSGSGEGLIVFKEAEVGKGANVYVTKEGPSASIEPDVVEELKKGAKRTYVEVVNTGATLQLIATSKYFDGNDHSDSYTLTKEISLTPTSSGEGNDFTGNIKYEIGSDTRYLRIHVKPAEDNMYNPYIYTWATEVNKQNTNGTEKGTSAIVNHLIEKMGSGAKTKTYKLSGEWLSDGPQQAMVYEGDGWYLWEIEISNDKNINYVNAIVSEKSALRSNSYNSQTWEIFGLPIPATTETGAANGVDVYITLNNKTLQDAQHHDGKSYNPLGIDTTGVSSNDKDDLSRWYQWLGDHTKFAQCTEKYFSVYTKTNEQIYHYRQAEIYDDTNKSSMTGWTYEGYGWYRNVTTDTSSSITINGHEFGWGGELLSDNGYGKEEIYEMFIVSDQSGTEIASFNKEEDANIWLASKGDTKAGDYVTVYAKGDQQSVSSAADVEISYSSTKINSSGTTPTPGTTTPTTGGTTAAVSSTTAPSVEKMAKVGESSGTSISPLDEASSRRVYYRATYGEGQATDGWVISNGYTLEYDYGGLVRVAMTGVDDTNPDNSYSSDYYYADIPSGVTSITIYNAADEGQHVDNIALIDGAPITFVEGDSAFSAGATVYFYNKSGYISGTPGINATNGSWSLASVNQGGVTTYGTPMTSYSGSVWWADVPTGMKLTVYNWETGDNALEITPDYTSSERCISPEDGGRMINLEDAIKPADAAYYVVGTLNGEWSHQFEDAKKQAMVTLDGGLTYTYQVDNIMPGHYQIKVISAEAECAPDSEGKTINYDYSWGKSYGSGSEDFEFFIESDVSRVTITFTVNSGGDSSKITYKAEKMADLTLTFKDVAFYNGALKHESDESQISKFTSPWSEVYVTYVTTQGTHCEKVDESKINGSFVWASVPQEAEYIYFSNMHISNKDETDYECTEVIKQEKYKSVNYPVFFPIELKTEDETEDGVKTWTMGDNVMYKLWTSELGEETGTGTMCFDQGSNKISYYNIPIVNMLNLLTGGKHAYSPYCWPSYGDNGGPWKFDKNHYVVYMNEKYYYAVNKQPGTSFLICNNQYSTGGDNAYGFLYENQFAFSDGNTGNGAPCDYEQHRVGATYTSTGYDAKDNAFAYDSSGNPLATYNYSGHSSGWYSYKIPAVTTIEIGKVTNIQTNSSGDVDFNTGKLEVVKAEGCSYTNQPIYLTYTNALKGSGFTRSAHAGMYTYDTTLYGVDTNENNEVSIYFDKNNTSWSQVSIRAVGLKGTEYKTLSKDATDMDTEYYKFTFDSGDYAYFVFYDGNADASSFKSATKKTKTVFFTGEEKDREYRILANCDGEMKYYQHARSAALTAWKESQAAYNESKIAESYNADGEPSGELSMASLKSKYEKAKDYYYGDGSGKWTKTKCSSYLEDAEAARRLVSDINQARIYLSNFDGLGYFPQESLKDENIDYVERWKYAVKEAYLTAMEVYKHTDQQNADYMNSCANYLEGILATPEITISSEAAIVYVNDAANWGKYNLHIYTRASASDAWAEETSLTVQDTTQSGYYAYVFKPKTGNQYAITRGAEPNTETGSEEDRDEARGLNGGSRYYFNTNTGEWQVSSDKETVKISVNKIEKGSTNRYYGQIQSPTEGKGFVLYFSYDTTVKYGSESYTIYAGAYDIDSTTYRTGWTTDLNSSLGYPAGTTGINLFSERAKTFFTTKENYGMSAIPGETTLTYKDCNADVIKHNGTNDVNLMYSKITANITATSDRQVNFRYNGKKDYNELKLSSNIELEAGSNVNIAVNTLNLTGGGSFIIKAKSVTFLTDVHVICSDRTTYDIPHGTYCLNDTATTGISLSNDNWMNSYTKISGSNSNMTGGTYVSNN